MNVGYIKYMREISSLSKKRTYAFIGNEDHFKDEAIRATLRAHRQTAEIDEELVAADDKKTKLGHIEDLLNEYPLIGKFRDVVTTNLNSLKNYEKIAAWLKDPLDGVRLLASFDEELKKLPDNLPFDVVVVCNSPGAESKEFARYIEYCLDGTSKKLAETAVETVKDLFANNIHLMKMELQKAAYYVGEASVITPEDVVRTTTVYPTSKVFDLVEALVDRDLIRSFRILHDLMEQGVGLALVIHLMAQRVQNIADAIRATATGEKLKDYMIRKKIPLFQYEQLLIGLRSLKPIHIKKFFDVLCEYEYKIKTSLGDDRQQHNAEMMILQLCR